MCVITRFRCNIFFPDLAALRRDHGFEFVKNCLADRVNDSIDNLAQTAASHDVFKIDGNCREGWIEAEFIGLLGEKPYDSQYLSNYL